MKWQQDNLWTDLNNAGRTYNWYGRQRETDDTTGGGDFNETVGIFYNPGRLEDLAHGDFWFCRDDNTTREECMDAGDGWKAGSVRMTTWIRLRDKTTGKEFYAVNTHLDNDASQARDHAAQIIRDTMAAMTPNLPIVLTGDFNVSGGGPHNILAAAGYRGTWLAAARRGEEFNTFRGDAEPVKGNGRIDFIYTHLNGTAGNVAVSAAGISRHNDANDVYPSDHLPVLSRLRLP